MSIPKALVCALFCSLFLAGVAHSQGSVTAADASKAFCDIVPTFPQYEDQTAGEVQALYHTFCGRSVRVAEKWDGMLVPYDPTVHRGWIVTGNHKDYPPQKQLGASEGIGVVLLPIKVQLWNYVLAAGVGLLIGLAGGYAMARK